LLNRERGKKKFCLLKQIEGKEGGKLKGKLDWFRREVLGYLRGPGARQKGVREKMTNPEGST